LGQVRERERKKDGLSLLLSSFGKWKKRKRGERNLDFLGNAGKKNQRGYNFSQRGGREKKELTFSRREEGREEKKKVVKT